MSDLDHLREATPQVGWRLPRGEKSLREVHGTVEVPHDAGFWRKLFAFAGPGYLVAVGYMDPGNWATDLAGGSQFGYALLPVILFSGLAAIFLQWLALRLVLGLQRRGFRYLEAFVIALVGIIAACFLYELACCGPDLAAIAAAMKPSG